MDAMDIRLCQLLFSNSRATVRELSDKLDISVQATHRRIQNLKDEGIIRRYMTFLSVEYLHTCRVYVSGRSTLSDQEEVKRVLRSNNMVYVVLVAGDDFLNISFIPKEIKDLDDIARFVRDKVRISDPFISIESQVRFGDNVLNRRYTGPSELSSVDYRIAHALQDDSRKMLEDIAEELELSPRTVRRHLDRMIEEGALEFGLDWNPAYSTGITSIVMVRIKKGAEISKVRDAIGSAFGDSVIFITSFVNMLDVLGLYCWTPTVMAQKDLVDDIGRTEGVDMVMSKMLQDGWVQDTWRDRMLVDRAGFLNR